MPETHDEARIRRLFQELRADEEGRVPSFERTCTGRRPTWRRRWFLLPAGAAVGVVAVLVVWAAAPALRPGPPPPPELTAFYWRSPTDALLLPPDSTLERGGTQ